MRISNITTFFSTPVLKKHIPYPKNFQKMKSDSFESTNPINFQGMRCSVQDFEIKRIKNLRCPICGQLMLSDEQQRMFINDVSTKKGEKLKESLEKYEDESVFLGDDEENKHLPIYRAKKQKIINIIKELAVQNPDLSLAELIQLHAKDCIDNLISDQIKIISEIEEYAESAQITSKEKSDISYVLSEYTKKIYGEVEERFKRKSLIQELQNIEMNSKDKEAILRIATKLPTSITSIDAFFVKYSDSKRSSREIARNIIQETTPTTEHLVPKSKKGKNNTDNYICDCADCNSSRGNILFGEWTDDMPNVQEGLQEYIDTVEKALEEGELGLNYSKYAEDLASTINKLSNGRIILEAKDLGKLTTKRRIATISLFIEKMDDGIINFENEIKKLEEHPKYDNIRECHQLNLTLNELNEQIEELEKRTNASSSETDTEISPIRQKFLEKLEELKQRRTKIEARIQELNSTIEVEEYANELFIKNEKIQTILDKIQTLEQSIACRELLEEHYNEMLAENKELAKINEGIVEKEKIDTRDISLFDEYNENERLFQVSETKIQELTSPEREKSERDNDLITLLGCAQNNLRQRAKSLFKNPSVTYFANLNKIQSNEAECILIKAGLEEIDQLAIEKEELEEELEILTQGTDIQTINETCEKIKKDREIRAKIENIESLKAKLEHLKTKQEHDKKILMKMIENYKTISEDEFQELLKQIQGQK